MKLTFLGTSHGHPGKNRFSSSVMVEIGEKIYIVDAGAPVSEMLFQRGISFDKVEAIFITHCHSDHVNGLPFFASLADSHVFPDCHTGIYIPDDVYREALEKTIEADKGRRLVRVRCNIYSDGAFFDDRTVKMTAIPNRHMEAQNGKSYSFVFEAEGKSILFTGDLTHKMDDFPKIAFEKHFDCTVSECAHATVEGFEKNLLRFDSDKVVVTHVFPDSKFCELENLKDVKGNNVIIANDNDEINI